jgi:hypothetical protein
MTGKNRLIGVGCMLLGGAIVFVLAYFPAPSQGTIPATGAFIAMIFYFLAVRLETSELHQRVLRLEAELLRRDQPQPTDKRSGQFFTSGTSS